MARRKFRYRGIYLPLMLVTLILTCVGLVMVLSSSYNSILIKSPNQSYLHSFIMQGAVAFVGIVGMFIISRIDYHFFVRKNMLISGLVLSFILLIAVFAFPGVRNSHRWIEFKGFTFQCSEFAKVIGVIYTAYYVDKRKNWYKSLPEIAGVLIPIAGMALLIFKEPDLSTTLCFLGAVLIILFVSGMPIRFVFYGVGAMVILLLIKVFAKNGYHSDRFDSWLYAWDDPKDKGYQVVQSLYAIGDGGLFGVGLGNSKQKITHLPMSDTDYIFSIICEEFGFVGALLVVCLYAAYMFFGIKIAIEASDKLGTYMATGITSVISIQAFLNMGVATNILPSTGLTLPFISKGASSLVMMLAATGILLSVSSHKSDVRSN